MDIPQATHREAAQFLEVKVTRLSCGFFDLHGRWGFNYTNTK